MIHTRLQHEALNRAFIQVDNARDAATVALLHYLNVWAMDLVTTRYQRCLIELEPEGLSIKSASGMSYCLLNDGSFHLNEIATVSDEWNGLIRHFHEVMGTQNPSQFRFDKTDCFVIKGPRHP